MSSGIEIPSAVTQADGFGLDRCSGTRGRDGRDPTPYAHFAESSAKVRRSSDLRVKRNIPTDPYHPYLRLRNRAILARFPASCIRFEASKHLLGRPRSHRHARTKPFARPGSRPLARTKPFGRPGNDFFARKRLVEGPGNRPFAVTKPPLPAASRRTRVRRRQIPRSRLRSGWERNADLPSKNA